MARQVSIRLSATGEQQVRQALIAMGKDGERALRDLERATRPASRGLQAVNAASREGQATMQVYAARLGPVGAALGAMGTAGLATAAGVGAVGVSMGVGLKQFASFEEGLIGVGKTTDLAGDELAALGDDLQALAVQFGQPVEELLAIAEAAGTVGVKGRASILAYTETLTRLAASSDLAGEEASRALARILNVTGESADQVNILGSVISRLGNNLPTTEREVARFALEIANQTAVMGLSSTEATALGAALASMGQRAEGSGSVVARTFRKIDEALRTGEGLELLQRLTGVSGQQLQVQFETDPTGVFLRFLQGLKQVEDQGGSAAAVLESLKLAGDENLKVLPALATNYEKVASALALANDEAGKGTALINESDRAFASLNADWERVAQSFGRLATSLGEELAPAARAAADELVRMLNTLDALLFGDDRAVAAERVLNLELKIESAEADLANPEFPDFLRAGLEKRLAIYKSALREVQQQIALADAEASFEGHGGGLPAVANVPLPHVNPKRRARLEIDDVLGGDGPTDPSDRIIRDLENRIANLDRSPRDQFIAGFSSRLDKPNGQVGSLAGSLFDSESERLIEKSIEQLQQESTQIAERTRLIGQGAGAQARFAAQLQIQNKLRERGIELTPEQNDLLQQELAMIELRTDAQERANAEQENWQQLNAEVARSFASFAGAMIRDADNIGDAFESLGQRIADALLEAFVFKPIEQGLTDFLSGGLASGLGSGLGDFFGNLFGGPSFTVIDGGLPGGLQPEFSVVSGGLSGSASGRYLDAGMMSVVGEGGPELFVPTVPGAVLPSEFRQRGGRTEVNLNLAIAVSGAGDRELEMLTYGAAQRAVREAAPLIQQAASNRAIDTLDRSGRLKRG